MEHLLTYIIFTPLFSALFAGIIRANITLLRTIALSSALSVLGFALFIAYHFDPYGGMQFVQIAPWIQSYGITYYVGVDAISLVVLLMSVTIMPALYMYIWNERRHGYWYNLMLLQSGVIGTVLSLDLILFYLFWEMMLMPIFIMIGRYGNTNHQSHAMKILVMTLFGSLAMFLSMLYMGYTFYSTQGYWSFALSDIASLSLDPKTSIVIAAGFLLAFAIKIPLVGFHTWMAPAYGSSPTPTVVILSAIMAKLGVYGIWRFGFELFEASLQYYHTAIITLALIGMLYYAIRAVMELNLRRMFAFSSGSHISLIVLGLMMQNLYAWSGSLYFIATHALASAGIFLMIGLTYRRAQTIHIDTLGGIAQMAPKYAFFFAFFALSIVGLPGTGGFVAELLIIIGALKYDTTIGMLAALSMVSAIIYVFWMLQRTLFGPKNDCTQAFQDLSLFEIIMLSPFVLGLLITGLIPSLFSPMFEPTLETLLRNLGGM